jgi:hypothetical protein
MALDNSPAQQPVLLQPRADAVDTYVKPQKVDGAGDNLMSLAKGLSALDQGLAGWMQEQKQQKDKEDALKGEIEFHRNNRVGYTEAVQQGLIPAQSSRAFMDAYKKAEGGVAGADLERKFGSAYDAWGDKNSEDPNAYNNFVSGFLKENLAPNLDPAVLAGLLPKIRSFTESGQATYITDRHKAVVNGATNANTALVDNLTDEAHADGLQSGKGVDYDKFFAGVQTIRQNALNSGLSRTSWTRRLLTW